MNNDDEFVFEHDLGKVRFDFKNKELYDRFMVIMTEASERGISKILVSLEFRDILNSDYLQDSQFDEENNRLEYALRVLLTRVKQGRIK